MVVSVVTTAIAATIVVVVAENLFHWSWLLMRHEEVVCVFATNMRKKLLVGDTVWVSGDISEANR